MHDDSPPRAARESQAALDCEVDSAYQPANRHELCQESVPVRPERTASTGTNVNLTAIASANTSMNAANDVRMNEGDVEHLAEDRIGRPPYKPCQSPLLMTLPEPDFCINPQPAGLHHSQMAITQSVESLRRQVNEAEGTQTSLYPVTSQVRRNMRNLSSHQNDNLINKSDEGIGATQSRAWHASSK